jgi:chromosome partitioning protein
MSHVVAIAGLKGGIGKSTITLSLAGTLHRSGRRSIIIDADSQATLRTWAAKAAEGNYDGPPVAALDARALRRDLERVSSDFEFAFIDSPPRLGAESRASMLVADLVLLPVVPGAADVWALQETMTVLEDARGLRPELAAGLVLNRTDRTTLAVMTKQAIEAMGVPVLGTLGNRVAFGEATLAGRTIIDFAPDSSAAEETQALVHKVLGALGMNHGKKKTKR